MGEGISKEIGGAGDVKWLRNIAELVLMHGGVTEEVGSGASSSGGAASVPTEGGMVVTTGGGGQSGSLEVLGQEGILSMEGSQLQVGIGQGAPRIVIGEEGGLDVWGVCPAPGPRGCQGVTEIKPEATRVRCGAAHCEDG